MDVQRVFNKVISQGVYETMVYMERGMCAALHRAYRKDYITAAEYKAGQAAVDEYMKHLYALADQREVPREAYLAAQLRSLENITDLSAINYNIAYIYEAWANRPYLEEIQDETER